MRTRYATNMTVRPDLRLHRRHGAVGLGETEVGCLTHARRKFYELWAHHQNPVAEKVPHHFGRLCIIEPEITQPRRVRAETAKERGQARGSSCCTNSCSPGNPVMTRKGGSKDGSKGVAGFPDPKVPENTERRLACGAPSEAVGGVRERTRPGSGTHELRPRSGKRLKAPCLLLLRYSSSPGD